MLFGLTLLVLADIKSTESTISTGQLVVDSDQHQHEKVNASNDKPQKQTTTSAKHFTPAHVHPTASAGANAPASRAVPSVTSAGE